MWWGDDKVRETIAMEKTQFKKWNKDLMGKWVQLCCTEVVKLEQLERWREESCKTW